MQRLLTQELQQIDLSKLKSNYNCNGGMIKGGNWNTHEQLMQD